MEAGHAVELINSVGGLSGGGTVVALGLGGSQPQRDTWFAITSSRSSASVESTIQIVAKVNLIEGNPVGTATFFLDGEPLGTQELAIGTAKHPISGIASGAHTGPLATRTVSTGSANITLGPLPVGTYEIAAVLTSSNGAFPESRVARIQSVLDVRPLNLEILQYPNPAVNGEQAIFTVIATNITNGIYPNGEFMGGWLYPGGGAPALHYWGKMQDGILRISSYVNSDKLDVFVWDTEFFEYAFVIYEPTLQSRISSLPATVNLQVSTNQINRGEVVVFTASVSSAPHGVDPTGFVSFYSGDQQLAARGLDSNGQATLTTDHLTVGTNSVVAIYTGDVYRASASSSPLEVQVDPPRMTTSVANGLMRFQWPAETDGYVIESTDGLGPSAVWTAPADQGMINGSRVFEMPFDTGETVRIFRLRKP